MASVMHITGVPFHPTKSAVNTSDSEAALLRLTLRLEANEVQLRALGEWAAKSELRRFKKSAIPLDAEIVAHADAETDTLIEKGRDLIERLARVKARSIEGLRLKARAVKLETNDGIFVESTIRDSILADVLAL